jgi:hypothetical protein
VTEHIHPLSIYLIVRAFVDSPQTLQDILKIYFFNWFNYFNIKLTFHHTLIINLVAFVLRSGCRFFL